MRGGRGNPLSEHFYVFVSKYKKEIKLILLVLNRYSYEQMKEERDKLRLSIMEANNRADLLAQEVDENHAKLEQSTQSKLL